MLMPNTQMPPRETRGRVVAAELRKRDVSEMVNWDHRTWGYEDRERRFHLSELGRELLITNGASLAADRIWERFNSAAKQHLSHPDVVRELRAAGVDHGFVARLEQYWQQTGKYETNDPQSRRQRGGISRFARVIK